jgi:hypothetical protein
MSLLLPLCLRMLVCLLAQQRRCVRLPYLLFLNCGSLARLLSLLLLPQLSLCRTLFGLALLLGFPYYLHLESACFRLVLLPGSLVGAAF